MHLGKTELQLNSVSCLVSMFHRKPISLSQTGKKKSNKNQMDLQQLLLHGENISRMKPVQNNSMGSLLEAKVFKSNFVPTYSVQWDGSS